MSENTLLSLTAEIVSSHLSHNPVASNDLPSLINTVYAALSATGNPAPLEAVAQEPAVSIKASVKPDFIVCLEDGKKLKMLKRHLMASYGMTPDAYRAKWKLPADYPMVAPNYAAQRRSLALQIGLGKKPVVEPIAVPVVVKKPRAPGRSLLPTRLESVNASEAVKGDEQCPLPAPMCDFADGSRSRNRPFLIWMNGRFWEPPHCG